MDGVAMKGDRVSGAVASDVGKSLCLGGKVLFRPVFCFARIFVRPVMFSPGFLFARVFSPGMFSPGMFPRFLFSPGIYSPIFLFARALFLSLILISVSTSQASIPYLFFSSTTNIAQLS